MVTRFEALYSTTARGLRRSVIRELLKLTRNPEIISFAGGLPDPATFPVREIEEISGWVIRTHGATALQYGPTEGDMSLREQLCMFMALDGLAVKPQDILITAGSQQGLDMVGKIFIDPGDAIIVELPSYIGGLQAFAQYRPECHGVLQDDEGMIHGHLEKKLAELRKNGKRVKFIYVVPDFQNPSGVTLAGERRTRLVELAEEYDTVIVEDSPYRALRFEGEAPPPIYTLDKHERVIYLSTFSKIFCPGFRLGWVVANPEIMDKFVMAKQALDLCSPPFTQEITAEYLARGYMPAKLKEIAELYRVKRDAMLVALDKYMPAGVKWTKPQGGLFLWISLPQHLDTTELFKTAIEHKVAYVTGSDFHCDGSGKHTMRVNFSYPTVEQIEEGVKRLAQMFKQVI
jgi:2-aminoadipate transaminase